MEIGAQSEEIAPENHYKFIENDLIAQQKVRWELSTNIFLPAPASARSSPIEAVVSAHRNAPALPG